MINKRTISEILAVSVLGTLLHFVYEWTGENKIAALFSAVNESVWEHLKLLFWPVLLVTAIEYVFIERKKRIGGFLPARFFGMLFGMLVTVTLYYTITGIVGKNIDFVNIAIFYIAVIAVFLMSHLIIKNGCCRQPIASLAAVIGFILLAVLFGIWSFNPPDIGIFIDPTMKKPPA